MDNIYLLIFYSILAIFILVTFFLLLYIRNQNMLWQQRKLFQETEILQQKQLLNAVIESQELERKRIGQDMHDEIGGNLSAIKLMLNALKSQSDLSQDLINPAKELIDQMITEVRHIAHELSPPGLAMFGLFTTLEGFISIINNTKQIEINMAYDGMADERLLSEQKELALFRVITQLIANTLKHANATNIDLSFTVIANNLCINYKDNGKGFDINLLNEKQGMGMQNIKSRLQMIDASYTITTALNNGFAITINCPIA